MTFKKEWRNETCYTLTDMSRIDKQNRNCFRTEYGGQRTFQNQETLDVPQGTFQPNRIRLRDQNFSLFLPATLLFRSVNNCEL